MRYGYRPRRRNVWGPPNAPVPKATGPITVDIDSLMRAVSNAPSHRARTTTAITAWLGNSVRGRNIVTLYDGRKKVERINDGRVVLITSERYGWRITTSATAEPTPMLLCQGAIPTGADKVAETGGMILYQTPASILIAAKYQAANNRRSITLAMLDQAIALKAKNASDEQVAGVEKKYSIFCNLAARALGGSHSEDGGVTDGIHNEAKASFDIAVKRGVSLIEAEWV